MPNRIIALTLVAIAGVCLVPFPSLIAEMYSSHQMGLFARSAAIVAACALPVSIGLFGLFIMERESK